MTPLDLERQPQLWYETALMAAIGKQSGAYAIQQRTAGRPEWLDCYDFTKEWLRFLNQESDGLIAKIHRHPSRVGKPAWSPTAMIAKPIGIDVTRRGTPPPRPGLHVAAKVVLPTKCLVIDQTHAQFDMSSDLHRDKRRALGTPGTTNKIVCFIAQATILPQAYQKWSGFLASKSGEVASAANVRELSYSELS